MWKQQQYWACWLSAELQVKQEALTLQEVWWKVIKQEYPPWVLRADTHAYVCMHTTLPPPTLPLSLSPRVCDQTLYQAVVVVMGKLLTLCGVLLSSLHSGMSNWWSTGHMWLRTAVKAGPIQNHRLTESMMNLGILFFFWEFDCTVSSWTSVCGNTLSQRWRVGHTFQRRVNPATLVLLTSGASSAIQRLETIWGHIELPVSQGDRKLTHIFLILKSSYDKYPLENKRDACTS